MGFSRRLSAALQIAAAARAAGSAVIAVVVAAVTIAAGSAAAQDLSGGYTGIGDARGMRVLILSGDVGAAAADPDDTPGPAGRFYDSNGVEAEFEGGYVAGGIEALLVFPRREVYVRFQPQPAGLQMLVLPFDAEGEPQDAETRVLSFVRDGAEMPERPRLFQPAPARAGRVTDPDVFLYSYPFWSPEGTLNGFDNIGPRYRTMLRFFPLLHADVLARACQARTGPRDLLSEALRGQGMDCAGLVAMIDGLQRRDRFADWKQAVGAEVETLMPAVQCARGWIAKEEVCAPASRRMAQAATSMQTIGTATAPWR